MKRSGDERQPPGGKEEQRRRLFEESRGLSEDEERELELGEREPSDAEEGKRDEGGGAP